MTIIHLVSYMESWFFFVFAHRCRFEVKPHKSLCVLFSSFYYFSLLLYFVVVFHNKLVLELRLLDLEWRQSLRLKSLMEDSISICGVLRCMPYWFNSGYPKHWKVKKFYQQRCLIREGWTYGESAQCYSIVLG